MNFNELSSQLKSVPYGVWDITGIPYLSIGSPDDITDATEEINDFLSRHPNAVLAHAYETYHVFILGEMPTRRLISNGSGFNYGSTNIIEHCPTTILILAEYD